MDAIVTINFIRFSPVFRVNCCGNNSTYLLIMLLSREKKEAAATTTDDDEDEALPSVFKSNFQRIANNH